MVSDLNQSVKKKATNAAQIHDIQGIVPPELKRLEVSDNGDILIEATDPENRTPNGGGIDGQYREELQDNWGNVYRRYFRSQNGKSQFLYYTPMPPVRPGDGEHRLELLYTTWAYQGGLGYDRIIEEREVAIPKATVKGIPDDWYRAEDARKPSLKLQAYRGFMWRGGMGAVEQMEWVNQILAEHPGSEQMLDYKIGLIEMLDSPEAAFEFFKQHRLDTLMQEKDYARCVYNGPLRKYLQHLYNSGQRAEFDRLQHHLMGKQAVYLSSKDRNAKYTQNRIKNFEDTLSRVLHIPQAFKQMQAGKGPDVTQVVKSSDGVVFIEVKWPDFAKNGEFRRLFNGPSIDKAIRIATDTLETHSLYQLQTSEKELVLDFQVAVEPFLPVASKTNSGSFTRFSYSKTVAIPSASDRTADQIKPDLERWRPAFAKRLEAIKQVSQMPPIYGLRTDAQIARRAGDYEQAIELYRSARDCNIPEDLLRLGPSEEIKARVQARILLDIAQCRIQQEDYTAALELAQQVQDSITDTTDDQHHYMLVDYGQARHVLVQIAMKYVELSKLDEAQALLEEIGKRHPNLRLMRDLHLLIQRPNGTYTWDNQQRRSAVYYQWQGYYRAVWQLQRAREASLAQPSS